MPCYANVPLRYGEKRISLDWIKAQKLTPNEFAKYALAALTKFGRKGTYSELAALIYRSESTIMTWCAPNSENPLPLHARHHIWLAISALQTTKPKHRRPWTQKDDDYLKEHYHKSTSVELAAALGRSYSAVASRVTELGIKSHLQINDDLLSKLNNLSLSNAQISKITGLPRQTIYNQRKKHQIIGYLSDRGRPKSKLR